MTNEPKHVAGSAAAHSADDEHVARGVAGMALAWKVAAFLPLVMLGALMVGRIDLNGSDPEPTSSDPAPIVKDTSSPDDRAPHDKKRDREPAKTQKTDPSESPSALETIADVFPTSSSSSSSPTREPDSSSPSPSHAPTKSPSPSPTSTPTPEEAEDMCRESGVDPLDLDAMAECINDMLDGN